MHARPRLSAGIRATTIFCVCWLGSTQVCVAQTNKLLSWQSDKAEKAGDETDGDNQPSKDATLDDRDSSELDDLLALDIDQLGNTEVVVQGFSEQVTTVARTESTVGQSPAAVFVITNEMIHRSGVRTIPDALRMAPGVQVAQIDANKTAVSIRGFNGRFANKLLVQIDGRTVYTPLFGGVFWDVQDVLLEDIDRIEVIRGPGATVWGANAVNGVINIITKSAKETPGFFAEAGAGNERDFASVRMGGQSGDVAWRAYSKLFDRGEGFLPTGDASDDWRSSRFGFRTDWQQSNCDTMTVQGDYYQTTAGQNRILPTPVTPYFSTGPDDELAAGGNVLCRWTHEIDTDSDWALQCYYDRTERTLRSVDFREDRDTLDIDFQHRFAWAERHSTTWGGGYRNTRDRIRNSFHLGFTPNERSDDLFSIFAQDDVTIREDLLHFIVGSKFQWNDYTGSEIQPTARLLYTPTERRTLWASFSRAVRVPSRASDDITLVSAPMSFPVNPTYPTLFGNRRLNAEELLAWEAGIRGAPTNDYFWDATVFYNQYENLHDTSTFGALFAGPAPASLTLPINFTNNERADSYGFELANSLQLKPNWNLRGTYSFLRVNMFLGDGQDAPQHQWFGQSSWTFRDHWDADLMVRYADDLSALGVPSYLDSDARLGWQPTAACELALVGRNLLDAAHAEFGNDTFAGVLATEVRRSLYGSVTLRY